MDSWQPCREGAEPNGCRPEPRPAPGLAGGQRPGVLLAPRPPARSWRRHRVLAILRLRRSRPGRARIRGGSRCDLVGYRHGRIERARCDSAHQVDGGSDPHLHAHRLLRQRTKIPRAARRRVGLPLEKRHRGKDFKAHPTAAPGPARGDCPRFGVGPEMPGADLAMAAGSALSGWPRRRAPENATGRSSNHDATPQRPDRGPRTEPWRSALGRLVRGVGFLCWIFRPRPAPTP